MIPMDEGAEWFAVYVRWVTAAKAQNARTGLCANFYEDIKTKYGSRP